MEEVDDLKEKILNFINNSEPLTNLKAKIRDKDVTILLGHTRSGKSTLANYLLGNGPTSRKADVGNSYKLEMLNARQGPQMQNGTLSVTSMPTLYTTQDGNILIDSPGFEDNRGIPQDIFNALSIGHIRFARSIKFVLVCFIGDLINDNVQSFTNLLKQMGDLVPNIEKINNSVCIIFTKDKDDITLDQLRTRMRDNILNEKLEVDKRLLPTLIGNIGIFKAPRKEGVVVLTELDLDLKNAINNCDYVDVAELNIKFALADKSNVFLKTLYLHYQDSSYFESEIKRTIEEYEAFFTIDQYVYASYGTELEEVQFGLEPIRENLQLLQENVINTMEKLKISLQALMDVKNLQLSPSFESDFDFILSLDNALLFDEECRQVIIQNYKNFISRFLNGINSLLHKIVDEYEARKDEKLSMFYEAGTFAAGLGTSAATFNTAKDGVLALVNTIKGAVGVAEAAAVAETAAIAAEGTAVVTGATTVTAGTIAGTLGFAFGTVAVGGALGAAFMSIKDSLYNRYRKRCEQNR